MYCCSAQALNLYMLFVVYYVFDGKDVIDGDVDSWFAWSAGCNGVVQEI